MEVAILRQPSCGAAAAPSTIFVDLAFVPFILIQRPARCAGPLARARRSRTNLARSIRAHLKSHRLDKVHRLGAEIIIPVLPLGIADGVLLHEPTDLGRLNGGLLN